MQAGSEPTAVGSSCELGVNQLRDSQMSESDSSDSQSQNSQSQNSQSPNSQSPDSLVSFQSELPQPLQEAMTRFIEHHPNWDQYRLVQAALAGFLVQNGIASREITRVYVGNMFRRDTLLHGV